MMTTRLPSLLLATAAAFALLVGAPHAARAGSVETDAITVGSLTEHADLAAIVRVVGEETAAAGDTPVWRVVVEELLRGPETDGEIAVLIPAGRAPVAKGGRFLAFLRRTEGGWMPEALPWAFRTVAEQGIPALAWYARGYAACLGADGRVVRTEALAEHLVAALGSTSSGVPFCAGRDLLRHDDVVAALTADQRGRVTDALRGSRKPDDDFASIVLAAGPCGGPGTDELLVARLLDPSLRTQRLSLTTALRRRASPSLAKLLASQLAGADAAQRADVANALGRLDLADAAPALLTLVRDEDRAVRIEAAHGLGLLARAVRAPRPGADPDAPRPKLDAALAPLVAVVGVATTENERRAALWAIAQIDTPTAWDALRGIAKDHADPRVREIAADVLAHPRTALLLTAD